uniref:Uncharacterized protein n=1 Tax=mine drainage metagenome TaxID=410659 RepID=E6Q406_9ZZZZ
MPRPFIIAGALLALALSLVACNSNNGLTVFNTPTAAPTVAPTPNPSITSAFVKVTASATPVPNVAVSLCTSNGCATPANVLQTHTTNASGEVEFTAMSPGTVYCFFTQSTASGATTTYQSCTSNWQSTSAANPLTLGT